MTANEAVQAKLRDPSAIRLLIRMLDTYEAGLRFERAEGRDVLLRLDHKDFPEEFAHDGHETLLALEGAIQTLEAARAIRVVRRRVAGAGQRVELRLGPGEISVAYAYAHDSGYLPLRDAISQLHTHVNSLGKHARTPDWWQSYLAMLLTTSEQADFSALKIDDRARLKTEWSEIRDALTAADALSCTVDLWERHLSESLFADSKRLNRIRNRVAQLLRAADPRWFDVAVGEATDSVNVVTSYGIRRRPPTFIVSGAIPIPMGDGRTYRLEDFVPVATLPATWAHAVATGAAEDSVRVLTTIENEYPFLSYVEEAGGPTGLGKRGEMAVYVGGFPSHATLEFLIHITRCHSSVGLRHWGDADAGGLAIWWLLRSRLERPVELFRTTAEWVSEAAAREGQRLTARDRESLRLHLRKFEDATSSGDSPPDVMSAIALARELLRLDMKLEQERI